MRLAREGARLVIIDLGRTAPQAQTDVIGVSPDLEQVAAEIKDAGGEMLALAVDGSHTADGIRVNCVCPGAVDTDVTTLNHEDRA